MKASTIVKDKRRSAAAMTVRAREVAAQTEEQFRFNTFARRREVLNMEFSESADADFRFVAERRPYNTRGLEMPEVFGTLRDFKHLPIQGKKTIDEDEIDTLAALGDTEAQLAERIGLTIPERVDKLTLGDLRRLDYDFLGAWATGTMLVKNKATKQVAIVSFKFMGTRYKVAATPWDDPSVNAYEAFVAWYRAERRKLGGGIGVYTSGEVLEAVREDAPVNVQNGLPLGDSELEALIGGQVGGTFAFYLDDRADPVAATADSEGFDPDTGTAPKRYWPVSACAVVPPSVEVGEVCVAPVRRADSLPGVEGSAAKGSNRDVTIVYVTKDDDTALEIQAQFNAYPALDERLIGVIDTGITE